jgi:hypothetical protein
MPSALTSFSIYSLIMLSRKNKYYEVTGGAVNKWVIQVFIYLTTFINYTSGAIKGNEDLR